jgi:hypothetical protein
MNCTVCWQLLPAHEAKPHSHDFSRICAHHFISPGRTTKIFNRSPSYYKLTLYGFYFLFFRVYASKYKILLHLFRRWTISCTVPDF